jgi:mono/diheme cytochrome c family protein
VGTTTAALAVGLGFILINQDDYTGSTITIHQWSGIATAILSGLTLYAFISKETKSYRLLLFLTVLGVSFAGHYGAMLTHGEDYLDLSKEEKTQKIALNPSLQVEKLQGKIDPNQKQDLGIEARNIIANHCYDCHSIKKSKGKLRLDALEYLLKGGEEGPALVLGHPEKSEMIRRIKLPASDDDAMPTKGKRLTKKEIEILEVWVKQGAPWPNTDLKSTASAAILDQKSELAENVDRFKDLGTSEDRIMNTSDAPTKAPEVLNANQLQELNINVRTILAHNCYSCHNATKTKGGLRLDKKEFIFKGGENGPILVAGNPEKSDMIRRVKLPFGHDDAMPTKGKRLSKEDVAMLEYWIQQGAPWPTGPEKSLYRVAALEPRMPTLPKATAGLNQPIDLFVNEYFKKNKISWQKSVDDKTYIRRVYLDVTGLLPSPESISAFVSDTRSNKREVLVDKLLANNEGYAQHWLTFWNDALRNDYSGTGYITNGRFGITKWLYGSLKSNKPYDTFVKELISPTKESEGFIRGIQWRGTINSSQSTEMQAAQNVSQVLLGLNLKCTSCHDSFISDWKLDEAYAFANVFSSKTLEIHRCDLPTGRMAGYGVLYNSLGKIKETNITAERLVSLADILVQKKNGRLYRTLVNRVWAQLMGRGIVEPVDMMDNEPWSQDLLDWLASDFTANGYDMKRLMRQILISKTYQTPAVGLKEAQMLTASNFVFKGMMKRRITAEQFADAVSQSFFPLYTDSALVKKMLPADIKNDIPFARASLVKNDPFLTALGRPNRENVSTSRISQANLLQALELTNGNKFNLSLRKGAEIWAQKYQTGESLVKALYLKALGREPSFKEITLAVKYIGKKPSVEGIQDLVRAVTLLPEFQLII